MIISEMQCKLATWSKENKERKFDRLLRLIACKDWLMVAAEKTLNSNGSKTPGIDGITRKGLKINLMEHIYAIRNELLSGTYEPQPARRVYIPKANGKTRPLGIICLRDRIVQRAMLMVMEPIWENDFHRDSYGFRPNRSAHQAIQNIVINLQDSSISQGGRWIIEGDLSDYFSTVQHKLLISCIKRRIQDKRFINLLWKILKAGVIDKNVTLKTQIGVQQGAVLSPLLSNILLNEFDSYMDEKYLCEKARRQRGGWNVSVRDQTPIALREKREWKPAISYARFADDFVLIVKGSHSHATTIREEINNFLTKKLRLTLNMEKTHITHVNDGFTFLGHRVIRKRGSKGSMRPVTQIPRDKFNKFSHQIVKLLSGNHNTSKIDMVEKLNQLIIGWTNFYCYTTYTAILFQKLDTIIFWKLGHWLAQKYKTRVNKLIRKMYNYSRKYGLKTWIVHETKHSRVHSVVLRKCTGAVKKWHMPGRPRDNPYLNKNEIIRTDFLAYINVASL
jgi:RNA-directed DNA polymerase